MSFSSILPLREFLIRIKLYASSKTESLLSVSWEKKTRNSHKHNCPIKIMFVDILIAYPSRNTTQPTPVEFKHLMIGWRKLSERRTAHSVALSFYLVLQAVTCMVVLALVRWHRSGLFEGGIMMRRDFLGIGCW